MKRLRRFRMATIMTRQSTPDGFTLPDIYGEDWTIERGPAGVFGRKFYNFITDNPDLGINYKDMGKNGRRAHYTYNKNEQQCD